MSTAYHEPEKLNRMLQTDEDMKERARAVGLDTEWLNEDDEGDFQDGYE